MKEDNPPSEHIRKSKIKQAKNAVVQASMYLVKERESRIPTVELSLLKRTRTGNRNHPPFNNQV
jgi:hypothetical protein